MQEATAYALVAVLGSVLCASIGAVVLAVRPRASTNRSVGAFFVTGGLVLATGRIGALLPAGAVDAARLLALANSGLGLALLPVYLLLLGAVVRTPLSAPFRPRGVRISLGVLTVALTLAPFLAPSLFIPGFAVLPDGTPTWDDTWASLVAFWVGPLAALFAVACTLDAVRRAPRGSPQRARAKGYALSFGILDGAGALVMVAVALSSGSLHAFLDVAGLPLVVVVMYPIMAHALLKRQVVDLDLRIRVGLKRSTLAACFGAAFWLGEQTLQQFIPVQGFWLGLACAAALALAFRPLERAVDRILQRALPASARRPDERALDVYRAALETAWEERGAPDPGTRAFLDRLRAKLDVSADDAARLEAQVAAAA